MTKSDNVSTQSTNIAAPATLDEFVLQHGIAPDALEKLAKKLRTRSKAQTKNCTSGEVIASTRSVTKLFNRNKSNQVTALQDVSLDVHEKEIVALVGPSGSGKSTLLNIMAGLEQPTDGSVVFGDQDIARLSDAQLSDFRARSIGFVFQFFYLQPFLSLEKNIQIPLMFAGVSSAQERQSSSDELIELVGLSDRKQHRPKELSGGQMQRVAIARALINRPKLIIADEPTGNLDSENARIVMDLFDDIRSTYGSSVLVVTHDSNIADMADRVVHLSDGKIVEE